MAGQTPGIGEEVPEALVPSVGEDVSHLMAGSGSFDVQKQNEIMRANMAKQNEGRPFMQTHPKTRQVVRGALDTLPATGAIVGGSPGALSLLAAPVTGGTSVPVSAAATVGGAALGAGVGRGARDLLAEALGVEDVTSPLSKAGRIALDTAIQAVMPAVSSRAKDLLTNAKATFADIAESLAHPIKGGQQALDAIAEYLRATKAPLGTAQFADDISGQIERYAPNVSSLGASPSLTAEQMAAQQASGHALPPPTAAPKISTTGVPAAAMGPEASVRAATMRAATAGADPARDVAVVKTLIANGVPMNAAIKQVAGNSPQRFGSLMTLYLRSRQVK